MRGSERPTLINRMCWQRDFPTEYGGAGNALSSVLLLAALMLTAATFGCGVTRMSDTQRTGNEQLLLSAAIDQAINQLNFEPLKGQTVYLDATYLKGVVDEQYIVSSLRQHMLAHGCKVKEQLFEADFVVEARAGAVGTNRHDVLVGVPSVQLPNTGMPGVPASIPEIPFAKSSEQKGVAKIAVFAYHRDSGDPIWQSGAFPVTSTAKDTWVLGAGPFQRGTIYDGTRFAGSRILLPFRQAKQPDLGPAPQIPVTAEALFFTDTPTRTAQQPNTNQNSGATPQSNVYQRVKPALAEMPMPDASSPQPEAPRGRVVRIPEADRQWVEHEEPGLLPPLLPPR